MTYTVHTLESAPDPAKPILESVKNAYGFTPNLFGVMAAAPPLAKAYAALSKLFAETSFSATERNILLLAVSYENGCDYCMAAHSAGALGQDTPQAIIDALREGKPLPDRKLEALRALAAAIVNERGRPSQEKIQAFLDAGYGQSQILEIVLGVGMKTLSNYTNHIAETPLDTAFQKFAWSKAE